MTNKDMHMSAAGIALLINFEGLGPRDAKGNYTNMRVVNGVKRWYPYKGQADAAGVWTVGYGHVCSASELKYYNEHGITEPEARALKLKDLKRFEEIVKRRAPMLDKQHEFDAAVMLVYNCGEGPFNGGFGRAVRTTESRKDDAERMLDWVCDGNKKVSNGLIRRRIVEAHLFFTGSYTYASNAKQAVSLLDKLIACGIGNVNARYNQIRKAA